MQEIIDQIVNHLKAIWLNKFYIVLALWIIAPLGFYLVWHLPDKYESRAQVYVDTQSLLRPLLRGLTIQPNTDGQIRLMVKTLMTRPNLEKIARMADLDLATKDDDDYEEMINELRSNLRLRSSGRENIFTIHYENENPKTAQKVVQSALNVFVENTLGESRGQADTAGEFLDRQVAEYEERLLADERKLAEFKQKYSAILGVNISSYHTELEAQKSRLAEARLKLRELNSQLESAKAQLQGEQPAFGLIQQKAVSDSLAEKYDNRIAQLRSTLDDLSIKYTDKHPKILELKRRIEDLESERDKELKELTQKLSGNEIAADGLDSNPVYQQLKLNISRLETEKASLEVRVKEYEDKVAAIQDKIHLIPEIESELTALTRGYDITKQKYNELLSRREQARLSQNADLTADDIQFKVVDPPRAPIKPSGPNRILLYTAVLVLGIAAGVGLALLVSLVRPVLISGNQLTKLTGYPVFGIVAHAEIATIKRKARLSAMLFMVAILLVVGLYGVLIAKEIAKL